METLVTWRADQGTAEARQRTRHETIGALDGFAQHKPRANLLTRSWLYGVARFFPCPAVRRSREVEGLRGPESLSKIFPTHLIF